MGKAAKPARPSDAFVWEAAGLLAVGQVAHVPLHLLKRIDQPGMVPSVEVLLVTAAVRNLIRENRIYEIQNVIETSRALGMQTMDTSLKQLFLNGKISKEDAVAVAHHPEKLERQLHQQRNPADKNGLQRKLHQCLLDA